MWVVRLNTYSIIVCIVFELRTTALKRKYFFSLPSRCAVEILLYLRARIYIQSVVVAQIMWQSLNYYDHYTRFIHSRKTTKSAVHFVNLLLAYTIQPWTEYTHVALLLLLLLLCITEAVVVRFRLHDINYTRFDAYLLDARTRCSFYTHNIIKSHTRVHTIIYTRNKSVRPTVAARGFRRCTHSAEFRGPVMNKPVMVS